ncbi:MAG: prephenate dehydrogenase/arogenate dehydrogenase family protein [Nitrososphaerales archaeon]
MNIAIIGAAGNMGKWFTSYFVKAGNKVKIYDVNKEASEALAKEAGVEHTTTLHQCINKSDILLVSTPIDVTPKIIAKIGKITKQSALLVEITSIKAQVMPALKRLKKHITPLSLHPLFGPGLTDLKFGRMIVVKVNDVKREVELARMLFPEAKLTSCTLKEHDKMVAYSLTLPYFMNLAYGLSILNLNIADLRQHAGTTLSLQLDLLEGIIQGSKHLIPTILAENPYSLKVTNKYFKALKTISENLNKEKELKKILLKLEKHLSSDPNYQRAYQTLYDLTKKKSC